MPKLSLTIYNCELFKRDAILKSLDKKTEKQGKEHAFYLMKKSNALFSKQSCK